MFRYDSSTSIAMPTSGKPGLRFGDAVSRSMRSWASRPLASKSRRAITSVDFGNVDRPSRRMHEAVPAIGRLGQHVPWQTVHVIGEREHRIHQDALRRPGVGIPSREGDGRRSSVPRLVVDDAEPFSVDGVSERRREALEIERLDAGAWLLVRRERDRDRSVRDLGFWRNTSTIVRISAMPALSSDPSNVVPSAVMMSSPTMSLRTGFAATEMTSVGSPGSTISLPW